jgi:hypothetical protein
MKKIQAFLNHLQQQRLQQSLHRLNQPHQQHQPHRQFLP